MNNSEQILKNFIIANELLTKIIKETNGDKQMAISEIQKYEGVFENTEIFPESLQEFSKRAAYDEDYLESLFINLQHVDQKIAMQAMTYRQKRASLDKP